MNQGNPLASDDIALWTYFLTVKQSNSLFSKEAVIVTKVDQTLVIESKTAETVSHWKALKESIIQDKH